MSPKKPSRLWRWTKGLLKLGLLGLVLLAAVMGGTWAWFSRDLPSVEELRTWRPPQVTKVNCRDGSVCAEFYLQRRTWVDVTTLPKHVRESFLAAEDADFYSHQGLDYAGILRSAVKNLKPGGMKSGASTISQQACRLLLLTQERTLSRKIREWILTPRMEQALGKDQVLNLYVNTIYFGHNRYGVEEAALFYFGKHARDLSLGEAAVLAGTVQLPHRINPVTNIVKAKKRQRYVLNQLASHGFVAQDIINKELEKPIVLGPRPPAQVGASYAEEVRKQLVARYGEKAVMEGGLRVQIAMEPALQAAWATAVPSARWRTPASRSCVPSSRSASPRPASAAPTNASSPISPRSRSSSRPNRKKVRSPWPTPTSRSTSKKSSPRKTRSWRAPSA
jgi:penicillin-binding protein 1A